MGETQKHEHRFIVLSEDERWLKCAERGCEERIPVTGRGKRHGSVAQSG